MYIPQSGNISIYSNKIGYVGVNPLIVSGTLKENLIYGNRKEVEDTQIHKLIEKFSLFEDEIVDLNKAISIKNLSYDDKK